MNRRISGGMSEFHPHVPTPEEALRIKRTAAKKNPDKFGYGEEAGRPTGGTSGSDDLDLEDDTDEVLVDQTEVDEDGEHDADVGGKVGLRSTVQKSVGIGNMRRYQKRYGKHRGPEKTKKRGGV